MGNANWREEAGLDDTLAGGAGVDDSLRSNGEIAPGENRAPVRYGAGRVIPGEVFPMRFQSPMLISPRVPVAPSQKSDGPVSLCQIRRSDALDSKDPKQGIPVIITWNYGGNDVLVEGSWDNWISRYVDYVPEHPGSIAEFEAPPSPESGYSQVLWAGEDFATISSPPSASLNSPWSHECGARSFQAPAHGAQPPLLREREILTIRGCHGIDPQVRVQVYHRGPL